MSSMSDQEQMLLQMAAKWKVVPYGLGGSDVRISVEVKDPKFRDVVQSVVVSRVGGMGLELLEMEKVPGKGPWGLVCIGGVNANSNAASPVSGSFAIGDTLKSVEGVTSDGKTENKMSLEGLDFDATLDVLSQFSQYDKLQLQVKRLVERNIVIVDVCGPDGVPYTKLKVLSGFGVNMRTLLQASNINMYAGQTARFDSPYQTGNCAGEGTCGTCIVSVVSGSDLLNQRVRVEDAALRKQVAPPNWRWACRTIVGADGDRDGTVKIKLRPQTQSW